MHNTNYKKAGVAVLISDKNRIWGKEYNEW